MCNTPFSVISVYAGDQDGLDFPILPSDVRKPWNCDADRIELGMP